MSQMIYPYILWKEVIIFDAIQVILTKCITHINIIKKQRKTPKRSTWNISKSFWKKKKKKKKKKNKKKKKKNKKKKQVKYIKTFKKKKKKKKSEKKLMENVKIFLRKKEKKKCGYYRERNKNLSED